MLFSDEYKEPSAPAEATLRERGSRFLAFAYPVQNEATLKSLLQSVKQQFPDATHHCYAVVMHPDKSYQRSNDDGEPSNTAGRPILRMILSKDLTNVLVVVVRYFGGTQLGIPGLIKAYGDAAKAALDGMEIQLSYIEDYCTLCTDFSREQDIHRLVGRFQARLIERNYDQDVCCRLAVKRSQFPALLQALTDFPGIRHIKQ